MEKLTDALRVKPRRHTKDSVTSEIKVNKTGKMLELKIKTTVCAVILLMSAHASIFGSWGLEVGRANAGDVIRLQNDWLYFKQMREPVLEWGTTVIGTDRQRQLLGVAKDATLTELYEKLEAYWWKNLVGPLQRIALNPAASCPEAQYALMTMIQIRRQQQLLGLEETEIFTRVYETTEGMASYRCRNEALDECVATGRFMQILELMGGSNRQTELMGRQDSLENWAEDALKQCAIYELHYVSRTKSSVTLPRPAKRPSEVETVRDGRVKIQFEIPPGGLEKDETSLFEFLQGKKLGEVLKGKNEKMPFFVSVRCQSPVPEVEWICSPGTDSLPINVRIEALDLRHREFYMEYEKDKRLPFKYTESEVFRERLVGEDKFSFEFEGGEYQLQGLLKLNGRTMESPVEYAQGSFYMAHKKDWARGSDILKIEKY